MMQSQKIKAAIADTLRRDGLGYFRLDTADQQSHAAEDILYQPLVHVYYDGGDFPKSPGTTNGKQVHDAKYKVVLSVAGQAAADLANLDSDSATPSTIINALASSMAANDAADTAFDNLVSVVWNILRNPRNSDFGLGSGYIANLWIDQVVKSGPQYQGDVIILSGTLNLSLRCVEYPTSETQIAGAGITTDLKATTDQSADPKTVGFESSIPIDPKFDTAPLGAKVGS